MAHKSNREQIEILPNAVYTLRELCEILHISDATARRWIKDGKIRASRVGRAYRFLGSNLLEALNPGHMETNHTIERNQLARR
jgi:excisionase family DNA binding protein